MEIKKYITENEPKMLEDLFSLIRIPSISAKPEHHDDMRACAGSGQRTGLVSIRSRS